MDTKKLRQKILDLAIRGKLVPQDPNDEPASVLLERIRTEKERLIKEGKIKRSKKSASDDEIEAPFEIPDNWVVCKLEDIAFIGTGATPDTRNNDYYNGIIPWVSSSCTKYDYIETPTSYITQKAIDETNCRIYPKGTLIMAMYGEGKTRGQISELKIDAATNQACAAIVPYNISTAQYIKQYLKRSYLHIREQAEGGTQPNLNLSKIAQYDISLPPLYEQQRIVDAINHWFAVIDALECNEGDLLKAIDQAKSKILDLAIHGKLVPQDPNDKPASDLLSKIHEEKKQLVKEGKLKKKNLEGKTISEDEIPFEIPENWEWVRLKTISSKIVDGDHNPPSGLTDDSGFYMLSSKNIIHDSVEIDDVRFLSYDDWKKCNERTNLMKGDVLLTTVATLGRSCVYENDVPYCFQRSVSIISTYIYNYFLKYCFDSPYYQSLIDDKATGTAQRGFYINQLEESVIPVPPLAEQKRIVAKIKELFSVLDSIKESLE